MFSDTLHLFFSVVLFGVGAFALAFIPSVWPELNGLHPEVLTSDGVLRLKVVYVVFSAAPLLAGFAMLLRR